jgi:hypothetical protein
MPNPENFPNVISVPVDIRPNRLNNSDTDLFQTSTKQVLFGTDARDSVELWIYNPNGSLATHITLDANDDALGLNTVIDNTGAYEYVNLDMTSILSRTGLEQGRYQLVVNFLRTEVGNEIGNKLFIQDISPDRTELQLHAQQVDQDIVSQIYEFVVPSVPRTTAQGLIDLVFHKTVSGQSDVVNESTVASELDLIIPDTIGRIADAHAYGSYSSMINEIINESYRRTLNNMAADTNNLNIQDADLESYIKSAVQSIIQEYKDSGRVDPRFNIF